MINIPTETYEKIVDAIPILCVDAIIRNDKGEYLLVKRTNEPLKGEWWVPGGRVFKGELLEDAVKRKVKGELGIDIKVLHPAGYYEDQFAKNPLNVKSGLHTLGIAFFAEPMDLNITLDDQHKEWGFFKKLPKRFLVKPFSEKEPVLGQVNE